MRKKLYTRINPSLFKNGEKKLLPQKYFETEEDFLNIYMEWFDYYDPIGFFRRMGLVHEYGPEARDLIDKIKYCKNSTDFAAAIKESIIYFFGEEELEPVLLTKKFNRQGFRSMAESGWALWYRYQFDIKNLATHTTTSKQHKKHKNLPKNSQFKLKFIEVD